MSDDTNDKSTESTISSIHMEAINGVLDVLRETSSPKAKRKNSIVMRDYLEHSADCEIALRDRVESPSTTKKSMFPFFPYFYNFLLNIPFQKSEKLFSSLGKMTSKRSSLKRSDSTKGISSSFSLALATEQLTNQEITFDSIKSLKACLLLEKDNSTWMNQLFTSSTDDALFQYLYPPTRLSK